jgi:hypothetical protein
MTPDEYLDRVTRWFRDNFRPLVALLIIVFGLGFWFASPIFHGLLIGFYANWFFWLLVVIGTILLVVLLRRGATRAAAMVGGAWLLLLLFFLIFGVALQQVRFYNALDIQTLDSIPRTEGVRYLPLEVAARAAQNQANEPRVQLGDFEPFGEEGGTLGWVAPREPSGGFNVFTYEQQGVATVRGEGEVEVLREPFRYGEGMSITDNINWRLIEERFWVTLDDPYYSVDDGEPLMLVPYLRYRLSFPVTIPYWAGTFVVHPDGEIEDLTAEEIVEDERFANERLYPASLARRAADSLAYQNGIWNAWVTRRDVPEVPVLENSANQMPFLLPTEDGSVWYTALEPYGPSNATYTMLYADAHTGEHSVYRLPFDEALIGPNRSFGFVTNAYPNFQWIRASASGETGNVVSLEPRPVVREDPEGGERVLYWMLSVTTRDSPGINLTAFVDSRDGAVTGLDNYQDVLAFARNEEFSADAEVPTGASPDASGEEPSSPAGGEDSGADPGEIRPEDLSDEELVDLLREAADRLEGEGTSQE